MWIVDGDNGDDAQFRSREHFSDAYVHRLERGRDAFVGWAATEKSVHEPYRLKVKSLDLLLEAFANSCRSRKVVYEVPLHATLEAQIQRPEAKKRFHYTWTALRKWHDSLPSSMRTPLPYPLMEAMFVEALVMAFFYRALKNRPVAWFCSGISFGLFRYAPSRRSFFTNAQASPRPAFIFLAWPHLQNGYFHWGSQKQKVYGQESVFSGWR